MILHTLFGMIDEEEFVSECINLIPNEDIKGLGGTCGVDESIGNLEI